MTDLKISLEAARVNAEMTQTEAAKAMNVTVNTLINWEKGRSEPSIGQARKIAKLYNVPLNAIFFMSDESN